MYYRHFKFCTTDNFHICLNFGPPLFSVLVNEFPVVDNTHRAAALVKGIQQALSRYIITVSLINFALGVATALALTFFGVDDALL